jgi:hypothetical protein
MRKAQVAGIAGLILFLFTGALVPGEDAKPGVVSYKSDVAPLLAKRCLPCHAEENANKSEFFIDSYALLMKGGKHGEAVVPGKPEKSDLIMKLSDKPPYGDRMPLPPRRKVNASPPKYLSDEEVGLLKRWISEGAKDN